MIEAIVYLWLACLLSVGVAVGCLLLVGIYAHKTRQRQSFMIQPSQQR